MQHDTTQPNGTHATPEQEWDACWRRGRIGEPRPEPTELTTHYAPDEAARSQQVHQPGAQQPGQSPDPHGAEWHRWRHLVHQAAQQVAADPAIPADHDRLERAMALVHDGAVTLGEPAEEAYVLTDSGAYHVTASGGCSCKDAEHHGPYCKHRLAGLLQRLALGLWYADDPDAAPAPEPCPLAALPEAPASINVYVELHGRKVQLTLRDTDEDRLLDRLDAILARFPLPGASEAAAAPVAPRPDWCTIHACAMRPSKEGAGYYHKDGEQENGKPRWCRGGQAAHGSDT
jgi:hypothetical protein